MTSRSRLAPAVATAMLALAATAPPASAQDDVAAFYRGKTIQLRVGSAAGGGYDAIARAISRHMGRHIPGNPTIAVQNVTGGGGLKLLNDLYTPRTAL
jgi:tripartite-type tricarboxylate transporter receptor subunit TctC